MVTGDEPEPPRGEAPGADERPENGGAADEGNEDSEPTFLQEARRALHVDGVAFGARVRLLRVRYGWSLRKFSKRSGVAVTTIRNIEEGNSATPEVATALAIAQAFGFTSAGELLAQRDAPPPGAPVGTLPAAGGLPRPPAAETDLVQRLTEQVLRGIQAAQGGKPVRVTRSISVAIHVLDLAPPDDPPGEGKATAPAGPAG